MKNNIEKNLRKAFENYQPDLDNDEIWDNIEPHLKKKKKRRFIWLWFLLGAIGLGSLFVNKDRFNSSESQGNKQLSEIKSNKKQKIKASNEKEICLEDAENLAILTEDKTTEVQSVKREKVLHGKDDRFVANDFEEFKVADVGVIIAKELIPDNNQVEDSEEIVETYNEGISQQNNKEESIAIITQDDEKNKEKKDKYVKKTKKDKKKKKKKPAKKKKKKSKKKQRNPWQNYAQFTTGFVLPAKVLQSVAGGVGIGVLDKRRETESFVDAFAFNFNIQSVHKRGFVVQSGLEYLQIDEKLYFKEVEEMERMETGTIGIVENERGEVIDMITGEKLIKTTEIREVKEYNNYRFVNIPVGIGRSWKNRRNYYKFIGGLEYNVFFNYDGKMFVSQDVISSGAGNFVESPGLGLWFSGEYKHSINDRLSWVLAPKIRVPFNYFINPKKKKR